MYLYRMASLKWIILFFLAVASSISGNAGEGLKNKDKEEDFCAVVCGKRPDVVCNGDKTKRNSILCSCKDYNKKFNYLSKECKEETKNFCDDVCGKNTGVMCYGDQTRKEAITCVCKDSNKIFDSHNKTCKEKAENFCEDVCGKSTGVLCYGDKTKKEEITCACEDSNKIFKPLSKSCKDDECLIKCGIPYNSENDELRCETRYGYAECECKKWNMKFDSADKTCKVSCKSGYYCSGNSRCNADKFCVCEDGFEGEDCDVITGCKYLEEYCHAIGTRCVFDKNAPKKATCECEYGYVYDPKFNVCRNSYCYPNNPCKEGECMYDEFVGVGYCKCSREKYYNYKTQKCEDFPDKCFLMKYPCDENEVCINGKCKCKYPKEPGDRCRPRYCTPNLCFTNSNCSEHNGNCYCEEGTYYDGKMCKTALCNLHDFMKSCTCPPDTKRIEGGKCEPAKYEEICFKDCGYGVCIEKGLRETCKCFSNIAVFRGGKCILSQKFCPGGTLQKNLMKCRCDGQYTQADDGITCRLKTCEDTEVIQECASKGGECSMDWKGNGYYCKCPKGYEISDSGRCTDPCSIKKNIQACAIRNQICHNSFPAFNNNTSTCRCPPSIKRVDDKCYGEAEHLYMIKDIPVLKKQYKMMFGINKVLLNADLITSIEQTFSEDLFDYAYLYDYREEGDIIKCSAWINFKETPSLRELNRIKLIPKTFSDFWHRSKTAIVWPPNLFLGEKGLREVRFENLGFCSAEVKDLLCGKASICMNNECTCPEGFKIAEHSFRDTGDYKIQRCEDIDECATGIAICARNTICVNTFGNYKCVCKDGFKKRESIYDPETDKSDCYDMCTPSPCEKGKCIIKGNTFDCQCPVGYAGSVCDRADVNYIHSKNETVIVGWSLAVALFIVILAFLTYIIAMRKKRFSGNLPSAPPLNDTEMIDKKPVQGEVNKTYE